MYLCLYHVELEPSKVSNEMEPVLQIEFADDALGDQDVRRKAVKYVEENYKDIEQKMSGHQLGISIIMNLWIEPSNPPTQSVRSQVRYFRAF